LSRGGNVRTVHIAGGRSASLIISAQQRPGSGRPLDGGGQGPGRPGRASGRNDEYARQFLDCLIEPAAVAPRPRPRPRPRLGRSVGRPAGGDGAASTRSVLTAAGNFRAGCSRPPTRPTAPPARPIIDALSNRPTADFRRSTGPPARLSAGGLDGPTFEPRVVHRRQKPRFTRRSANHMLIVGPT